MPKEPSSVGCFAGDIVRATFDGSTGRTLVFGHTSIVAWAGHLCDLVLAGALAEVDGVVHARSPASELHPLVRDAFAKVQPALPRPWGWMFAPQVVDTNAAVADVRQWLVATGVWAQRRTLFGRRYAPAAIHPTPAPPPPAGEPDLRMSVLAVLVRLAKYGSLDSAQLHAAELPGRGTPIAAVLIAADSLVTWAATPGGGAGGMQ